ncbi:MAG: cytochrome P450 [Actinobacteria bacterium]|nr:cytochrome P450 [Actinomycetota bacterium]
MDERRRCPHLAGYAPLSEEQLRDPFPIYAKARREAPVFFDPGLGVWSVTRMDDVLDVLRDPAGFSSVDTFEMRRGRLPERLAERWPDSMWRPRMLVATDPPEHTALRKLMQTAFTPRRVAALEPFVRETCERLIDGFADGERVDLMREFANPLPLAVITRILGFDADRGPRLRQWTEDLLVMMTPAHDPDPDQPADAETTSRMERMLDVLDETKGLIAQRRRQPREDMISALVAAADADRVELDDDELVILALELALAGNDTTANLITHTVGFLLADRAQWEELLANRDLVPQAVEEGLRRRGSSRGLFRRTTREVEVGGVTIAAGDLIHLLFSATGHDEAYFDEPERFDLHRANSGGHLAFGRWTHFCLGAPLARLETRLALEALLERVPGLREVPDQELRYAPTLSTHTLLSYQVALGRPGEEGLPSP